MFQKLPIELLWDISRYLPIRDLSALSQTCHRCYLAFIPAMYQKVRLIQPGALFKLFKKLIDNPDWLHRAKLHVHNLQIVKTKAERAIERHAALGHISSGWDDDVFNNDADDDQENQFSRRMDILVNIILTRFPKLSVFVMDFDIISRFVSPFPSAQAAASLAPYCTPFHLTGKSPFHGSVRLHHYHPGNPLMLKTLLSPLAECSYLTIQTQQYLSLCAAIQDSLLTDSDIHALADLDLKNVRGLELAYIDDSLSFNSFKRLITSMPCIETLTLEWVLPPSLDCSSRLYRYLADVVSLYPGPVQRVNSTYRAIFKRHSP